MERLRYTLGRLNTTALGLLLIGLALALFVAPRFLAAPAPAPQPVGAVAGPAPGAPVPNGPAQPPAPPAPQNAAQPAHGVVQPAQPVGPERPPVQPDRLPPPAPHASWMGQIGNWFITLFTFTGAMTTLASALLVGMLLWRSFMLPRHETVDHV